MNKLRTIPILFVVCIMVCLPVNGQDKSRIIANPLNLNYRFMTNEPSRREAADPVLEYFHGKYYLFASKSGGYWSSPDLATWTFVPCKSIATIEAYAPTILVHNDSLFFLASGVKQRIFKTVNPDLDNWEEINTRFEYRNTFTDPAFFKDDNGNVYLYWGCSDKEPIRGVQVDPKDGFRMIGEPVILITHNEDKYGWEVQGENNELNKPGWNEGASMIKHNGKYFLQYASPGTQFRTYADGVYVSDNPLGPFEYAENSPFCIKPGGFIKGAGHGHTFKDKYGNYWHVATMKISVKDWFERRIGLFPAFISEDNRLYSHTLFTDYPFYIPDRHLDFQKKDLSMNWQILSYQKKITASSELAGYEAAKANDERVESWWAAQSGKPGEWLQVDLGKPMDIRAIQVNFADHNFTLKAPQTYNYEYVIEHSPDGNRWTKLVERTDKSDNRPHELIVFDKKTKTRYVRIKNRKEIPGNFSLHDFRIFGNGKGKLLSKTTGISVARDNADKRIFRLEWKSDDNATGYIVRWGVDEKHLNNAIVVYTNSFEGRFFNRDSPYYFSVDAFNENGITKNEEILN